jgi:hypothetical protein
MAIEALQGWAAGPSLHERAGKPGRSFGAGSWWRRVGVSGLALLLAGCVTPRMERNLADLANEQQDEFRGMMDRLRDEPQVEIGWAEAQRRMMADNLSLRQSRQQVEDAKRQTRRQWLSLVPRMAGYLTLGDNFSELTRLDGDSVNARLIANLNIPNPFEFYAGLYGAALQRQNAEWSHALDQRRAFTELHQAFFDQRQLEEQVAEFERRLAGGGAAGVAGAAADPAREMAGLRTQRRNLERLRAMQRTRMNQLLNTPGAYWRPVGATPALDYGDAIERIRIGERFGKLALNLQAVQVEGAILRRERVRFQQWPQVSFGLSGPPLYSSEGGGADYSSDNLWFFSGVSKSIDLTDPLDAEGVRDAEQRLRFTREQVRQRVEAEALRLLQARDEYRELRKEEARLERSIARLERGTGASDAVILLAELEDRRQGKAALAEVRRRMRMIDLQLVLWDEAYWK